MEDGKKQAGQKTPQAPQPDARWTAVAYFVVCSVPIIFLMLVLAMLEQCSQ